MLGQSYKMVKVIIYKQSSYPVKSSDIKKKLSKFFEDRGIVSDAEVNISLVGEKKMLDVSKKYLKDNKVHNVLSFEPSGEFIYGKAANFVYPPDGKIHLGEIIVCFPVAVREAKAENVLIDKKVYELIEHGAFHLLGIHHP